MNNSMNSHTHNSSQSTICDLCPRNCSIQPGKTGFCNARRNVNHRIVDDNYGKITAIALDPIEKKPLRRFFPGKNILSVGSYGCNLNCGFCQNNRISFVKVDENSHIVNDSNDKPEIHDMEPAALVDKALSLQDKDNIGIAYTYNEPLIGFEYVLDCSKAAAEQGLKNVIVTNGYINNNYLQKLLPYIDAMNIDLKAFTDEFYKRIGGDLETVKSSISLAAKHCHLEVTTLIIPGENDSPEEMEALSSWLAEQGDIPLHVSRFFPQYKYIDHPPTSIDTILLLVDIAKKHLTHVWPGNC